MRFLVALGTRPEIVKLAPIVRALSSDGHEVDLVVTGQQSDVRMVDRFLSDFALEPSRRDELAGDVHERFGALMANADRAVTDLRPDAVVVLGDTSTVPAFALAARRAGIAVAHAEAGLRSYNERSSEEVHRRLVAPIASLHLAPTNLSAEVLIREGVLRDRVHVVGNPSIDVLAAHRVRTVEVSKRSGVLVTAHRATNVDDPVRLGRIVRIVERLASEVGKVTFPMHPRTADRLRAYDLWNAVDRPGVALVEPLPYDELLDVLAHSAVVVTDSGGIQEEASWFGVPAVILRSGTPRWEGIQAGIATLAGLTDERAIEHALRFVRSDEQRRVASVPCLYGDGRSGPRIAALLGRSQVGGRPWWSVVEPDLRNGPWPWTTVS